jgi:class 3 adenylate cyclase
MTCTTCHADNADDAAFCDNCGAPLELRCGACGTAAKPGAKFCRKCGKPLGAIPPAPAAAGPSSRFASPEAYTPKFLAERILTSRAALEGELKLVTVLFADLQSSMELIADRSPEQVHQILDPLVQHMMDAVHRYEGTVNQVMGDGIMALFGAPLALEDHAVRACYAALHMQDLARRHAEEVRRTFGVNVHIRVGLNSGEVLVRSIGSDLRMDYSAVGQTSGRSARSPSKDCRSRLPFTSSSAPDRCGHVFKPRRCAGSVRLSGAPTKSITCIERSTPPAAVTAASSASPAKPASANRGCCSSSRARLK